MTDRITELESAVERLEANIDGLREQLVEANDRIRELEQELGKGSPDASTDQVSDDAPVDAGSTEEETTHDEGPDETAEDIIVA